MVFGTSLPSSTQKRVVKVRPPLTKVSGSALAEAPFLNIDFSVKNGIFSPKILDKRVDFEFEIFNFQFWMEMPIAFLLMVFIYLQPFHFARICSNVSVFRVSYPF